MYYGWFVVMSAGVIYALIMGTTFSAFGLFVVPVSADLQLSRAEMNSALILLNVGSAVLAPFIGRLLDWIPARRVMIVSALLFGLSFALLSASTSIWLNAAIFAVILAAAVQGGGTLTVTILIARWFTARRGRAMLLAAMGMSLGSVLIVPGIAWLIEQQGWRTTLMAMSALVTIVLLAIALTIRERPRPGEMEGGSAPTAQALRDPAVAAPAPARIGALLRMPQFWTITLSSAITMGMMQTIIVSVVPIALGAGLSMVEAATLMSLNGGAAIATKLLLALLADRIDRIILLAVLFGLGVVANLLLLADHSYVLLTVCAIILGIASSATAPVLYALLADRFGTASFGTVRGLISPPIAVMGALGLRASGEVFDRTGSYTLIFQLFVPLGVAAVLLILLTRWTSSVRAGGEATAPSSPPIPVREGGTEYDATHIKPA